MADKFQRGQTFVDGQAQGVTADKLHALIEGASPTTAFITDLAEKTVPATGDQFPIYDAATGLLKKLNYENTTLSPSVIPGYRNLVANNNSGSPTTTLDITIDDAVLKNTGGAPKLHSSVSLSANITVSGANGLDTGVEASSTWYYLWIISDGTTAAALLSTSATAPTMPANYTYKTRVGGVYNNGSGNFWTFRQLDDHYFPVRQLYPWPSDTWTANTDPTSATGYKTLLMDGSSSKPFVPPIAVQIFGTIGFTTAAGSRMIISASTDGIGAQTTAIPNIGTLPDGFSASAAFNVPIVTSQTTFLKNGAAVVATTGPQISISGFRLKR